jgi:hypothetical protein
LDIFTTPWVGADGSVPTTGSDTDAAWTGAAKPNQVAALDANCNDWRDATPSASAIVGNYDSGTAQFFDTKAPLACDSPARLYCVEP